MSIEGLSPILEEMITTRRVVGKTGRVYEGLAALSTPNNIHIIHQMMVELRPERTLEIGLSFGGSALAFCASHRDNEFAGVTQHVAIDPFQTTNWDSCGLLAIERAGLSSYLDFRPSYSAIELPAMFKVGDQFGLIYVDGSHLFEDVFIDVYFGIRMLRQNGVILLDDSSDPHVAKAIRFLRTIPGLQELDLAKHNSRPLRYRAARLLGKAQLTGFRRVGSVNREWNAAFQRF